MKDKLPIVLFIVGAITAIHLLVFMLDYSFLKADVNLLHSLLINSGAESVGIVYSNGLLAHLAALFVWSIIILALGFIWSNILAPRSVLIEKAILSFSLGLLIMPVNFLFSAWLISLGKLVWTGLGIGIPQYYTPAIGKIVTLFASNLEQSYELVAAVFFSTIGLFVLGFLKFRYKTRWRVS